MEILKKAGYLPALVVTSPDAPKGRGLRTQASATARFAEKNKIPCLKPSTPSAFGTSPYSRGRVRDGTQARGGGIDFDLFIVVAYGKIMPENILNMPKFGSINIHYSLLPKYRGASPVESAILNGETETGVTIQKMELAMDSGPIIAQEKVKIFPDEKAPDLRQRLIKIGGELLVKTLKTPFKNTPFAPRSTRGTSPYIGGGWVGVPQEESKATYCKKIKKEDGLVNLEEEPPSVIYNKFRAYAFWPRTFFFKDGKRIIITDAVLEDGKFVIKKIIPEGGKEVDYKN